MDTWCPLRESRLEKARVPALRPLALIYYRSSFRRLPFPETRQLARSSIFERDLRRFGWTRVVELGWMKLTLLASPPCSMLRGERRVEVVFFLGESFVDNFGTSFVSMNFRPWNSSLVSWPFCVTFETSWGNFDWLKIDGIRGSRILYLADLDCRNRNNLVDVHSFV